MQALRLMPYQYLVVEWTIRFTILSEITGRAVLYRYILVLLGYILYPRNVANDTI